MRGGKREGGNNGNEVEEREGARVNWEMQKLERKEGEVGRRNEKELGSTGRCKSWRGRRGK